MQFPRWAPIVQAQLYTFISRKLYIDLKLCQKSPIGGENVHVYKTCPHLHKTIGSYDLLAEVSIGLSAPDLNFVGWPLIPSLVLFRSLSMWTAEQASFASQFIVFQFFSSKWSDTRECLITLINNYIDISSGKKTLFKVTHSKFLLIIVKDFSFLSFPIDCCFVRFTFLAV